METKPFEQVMERLRALRIDEPFDMIVAIAERTSSRQGFCAASWACRCICCA